MEFTEIRKDLFTVNNEYYLAHCIASDFKLGLGVATQFQKKFSLRNKLKQSQKDTSPGSCVLIGRIFNLITKSRSSGKPTYKTLESSLLSMKKQCEDLDVKMLAMPKIGCGLDRLQWGRVRELIKDIFNDLDIEILICRI